MGFSLSQKNKNGLGFLDLDLGPTGSTGHIYRYAVSWAELGNN